VFKLITCSLSACLAAFLVAVPARAGEPDDPAIDIEKQIARLSETDTTKVTLAAGSLIEKLAREDLEDGLRANIVSALRLHLRPKEGPRKTKVILLKVLVQKEEASFNRDIVLLACRSDQDLFSAAVDALKAFKEKGDGSVDDQFITVAREESNPIPVRVRAMHALNHLGSFKAIPYLIEARGDDNADIAMAAQRVLEGILTYAFAWNEEGWRAWWAENGTRPENEILREANRNLEREMSVLLEEKSPEANRRALASCSRAVRALSLKNLERLKDAGSVDSLLAFLDREPYPELRARAVGLLGELAVLEEVRKNGNKAEIASKVIEQLDRNSDLRVLRSTVETLGKIGKVKGLNLVKPLVPLLRFEDAQLRALTAISLGKIDGREAAEAVEPLCDMLAGKEEVPAVKREAANALGLIRDARAVPVLLKGLASEDGNVRWSCVNALANIGDRSAVESLLAMIEREEEARVLEVIVKALRNIPDPRAVTPLASLALARPALGDAVVEALLRIGETDGEDTVLKAVDFMVSKGGQAEAVKLLRAWEDAAKNAGSGCLLREASCLEALGRWEEASGVLLDLIEKPGEPKALFDRLRRALGQIEKTESRGRATALALARFPDKAPAFWEGLVRDRIGEPEAAFQDLAQGLREGFEGKEARDVYFESLAAFVSNTDGRVAASAHGLLAAWSGRACPALSVDAGEKEKKKAADGWRTWWTENRGRFPFEK